MMKTTNVTIGVTRIKALRRTVVRERTHTHVGANRWTHRYTHALKWELTHVHACTHTGTIIILHYIHLIKKKWNSTVPNVLFFNKNAYRGLKRSVLRSKSLFCFNHVWVLLLLNTDIHTYQGNEDTKTPRTPTTSGKHLMRPITRLWECACVYMNADVSVCLCVWVSPYQYRL